MNCEPVFRVLSLHVVTFNSLKAAVSSDAAWKGKGAFALKCAVTNACADELPEPLDVILISMKKVK